MSRGNDSDCKDFIKGVCFRGNKCKYRHTDERPEPETVPFCKDFMNGRGCHFERENGRECSFVHAPKAVVNEYDKTGWLPNCIVTRITERFQICGNFMKNSCNRGSDSCKYKHVKLGIIIAPSEDIKAGGEQMFGAGFDNIMRKFGICKDYAKDGCQNNGMDCKYKHLNPMECNLGNPNTTWNDVWEREDGSYDGGADGPMMGYNRGEMDYGMGMMGGRGMGSGRDMGTSRGGMNHEMGGYGGMEHMGGGKRMRMEEMGGGDMSLRGENQMLRIENEQLRTKVQELTATNKFLLEQNAEMRMKRMSNPYH